MVEQWLAGDEVAEDGVFSVQVFAGCLRVC